MKSKLIHEEGSSKTFTLVSATGDEVMSEQAGFANDNGLTAIGAFSGATLGYFDVEEKDYKKIPVEEQVEVLSLGGDIATKEDGEPQVHAPWWSVAPTARQEVGTS
jgi:uncharacterized protein